MLASSWFAQLCGLALVICAGASDLETGSETACLSESAADGSCKNPTGGDALLQQRHVVQKGQLLSDLQAEVGNKLFPYNVLPCTSGTAALITSVFTYDQYDAIVASVKTLYNTLPTTCNATYCPQADWTGCVLRMAGHDFMDYQSGVGGGSDGCVDFDDGDNAGLAACLYDGTFGVSMEDAYASYCTTVSLADFLVISAEAVMNITRQNVLTADSTRSALDLRSQFKYGRTTSKTCSFSNGVLPNPEKSCSDVQRVFVTNMGLTWSQAAALSAVHSLGRAHLEFSGYDGWWSSAAGARKFDNDYFIGMVGKGWKPEKSVGGNAAKNQWMRSDPGASLTSLGKEMMLNSDLCLLYTEDTVGTQLAAANTAVCCAWSTGTIRSSSAALNEPANTMCGLDTTAYAALPFGRKRAQCCGSAADTDCGSARAPAGSASSDVLDFANSETNWLTTFKAAWAIATSNGFPGLQTPISTTTTTTTKTTTAKQRGRR
mmetsp:Transcript_52698/g.171355  ORF Transcript_52698/g.171355 Transcript_52698/m.171355 type:complete len:489 (+) Transcript_52698:59-1525(+)